MRKCKTILAFGANAKLLNFAYKMKTASHKCGINMVTWSFLPFAVSVILNLSIICHLEVDVNKITRVGQVGLNYDFIVAVLLIPNSSLMNVVVCVDIGDGQLEVVGLENSLYVGQIIAGVRAHGLRLAQCSSITIRWVCGQRISKCHANAIFALDNLVSTVFW